MSKVNLQEALGIPDPSGPTKMDPQAAAQMMHMAIVYLLHERGEQSALSSAFADLMAERHKEFHTDHGDDWRKCRNEVCVGAARILEVSQVKMVDITPLSLDITKTYNLNIIPSPGNIRFWLSKRNEVLPVTKQSRIVLTDN